MTARSTAAAGWRTDRVALAALAVCVVVGGLVRLMLLPTEGLRDDLDQFVLWVHGIALDGLPNAYDQTLTFPPVMAFIWAAIAALDPAFQTAVDGSDAAVRIVMKLPATLADFGLAGLAAFALRARPRQAAVAAGAILLHPAVIDVSAWWGQYESIYLVSALAATVFAIKGHNGWAAAAIAVSLMTKPQALPLLVPFAAWFWAIDGWRGLARAAAIGSAVIVILWLPFLAAGGPMNYLENVATYQGDVFAILSLRAWNLWWLVQEAAAGGQFIADNVPFLGPLTLRHVGFALAGVLEIVVATAIVRDPRPRTLILGLAASVLVAFTFLTTMHERYAFGALVFLGLLIPEPAIRWLAVAFGIVFTLNLLAAVPPSAEIGAAIPVAGVFGIAGSVAMLAITMVTLRELTRTPTDAPT